MSVSSSSSSSSSSSPQPTKKNDLGLYVIQCILYHLDLSDTWPNHHGTGETKSATPPPPPFDSLTKSLGPRFPTDIRRGLGPITDGPVVLERTDRSLLLVYPTTKSTIVQDTARHRKLIGTWGEAGLCPLSVSASFGHFFSLEKGAFWFPLAAPSSPKHSYVLLLDWLDERIRPTSEIQSLTNSLQGFLGAADTSNVLLVDVSLDSFVLEVNGSTVHRVYIVHAHSEPRSGYMDEYNLRALRSAFFSLGTTWSTARPTAEKRKEMSLYGIDYYHLSQKVIKDLKLARVTSDQSFILTRQTNAVACFLVLHDLVQTRKWVDESLTMSFHFLPPIFCFL